MEQAMIKSWTSQW